MVAEAVHNVVKHAEATTVTIRLGLRDHTLTAGIRDDGRGLAASGGRQDTPDSEGGRKAGAGRHHG